MISLAGVFTISVVSVTDRCDLRCTYCRRLIVISETPGCLAEHHRNWHEGRRIHRAGVNHVRLTGGEPLVRAELTDIVRRISALSGIEDLISAPTPRLGTISGLDLKAGGVTRLNISLDSLDPATFKQLTGGDLARVMAGIEACRATPWLRTDQDQHGCDARPQ